VEGVFSELRMQDPAQTNAEYSRGRAIRLQNATSPTQYIVVPDKDANRCKI
jgi:hypothetical protein